MYCSDTAQSPLKKGWWLFFAGCSYLKVKGRYIVASISSCLSGITINRFVNMISVLNNISCIILAILEYYLMEACFYEWKPFRCYISLFLFNVSFVWMSELFLIFDIHCWNIISSNCLNVYVKYYIFGTVWYRPHFYTLYLEEPDSSGHRFGPVSSGVSSFIVYWFFLFNMKLCSDSIINFHNSC